MSDFERTFDHAAADYEQSRPDYGKDLYEDIFRYQPIGPQSSVLEIGVGTGKATRPILQTRCHFVGLEPGEHLAALAREKLSGYPNLFLCNQTLEDYTGADESFDLIYAATAFHWIPQAYGYTRVYQLLKHGGAFARFAYHAGRDRKRGRLMREIGELYQRYMPHSQAAQEYGESQAAQIADIAARYGFSDIRYHLYSAVRDFTVLQYLALLRTYPDHLALDHSSRAKLFQGIGAAIDRNGGIITVYYTIDLQLSRKP